MFNPMPTLQTKKRRKVGLHITNLPVASSTVSMHGLLPGGQVIRSTQVKSSGNENWMSPSRRLDGAYFNETPLRWHVRPHFSLIVIMNYYTK